MKTLIMIGLSFAVAAPVFARDPANPPALGDTPDGSETSAPTNADKALDRYGSETRSKDDDMLATAVSKSLTDDPHVSAMQVKVSADQGVVTLTGEVPGSSERDAAAHAASRVAGVREVRNRITVAERLAPGTSPIPERPAP
ncbi:MAG TPA: BON domain-containing protein [Candidatus Binatia bacterium]|jgi:hyperosmotically inducible protein|nr:BON domain-containing protein [Candidatus Binatia bacterium]